MKPANQIDQNEMHQRVPETAQPCERVYISKADGCVRWGIGQTTLGSLLRAGKIRSVKLGTRRLIEVADGDAWFSKLSNSN
nr:hypothetical protein [Nitrosomonas nitrosa]